MNSYAKCLELDQQHIWHRMSGTVIHPQSLGAGQGMFPLLPGAASDAEKPHQESGRLRGGENHEAGR